MFDVRVCLLFNPGPAIEAASLIIKKTVPFWRSFIQGFRGEERMSGNPKPYMKHH